MKMNKITLALIAGGIVSLAGAAQSQTMIYLTGSTAARQQVFNALTTAGQVFTGAKTGLYPAGETGSDNTFAVEGNVAGLGDTIYNCSFTGSEAGIAAVANQPLTQSLPNDPNGSGPYALPGTPQPSYLTGATIAAMTGATAPGTYSDLAMADTSQAVSRTSTSVAALHPFGIVGVVTFTFMKGYDSHPDAASSRLVNVPVNAIYQNLIQGDNLNACNYTGNTNDVTDGVAVVGRNFGSGTRANTFLSGALYPIRGTVSQYAFGSGAQLYPVATPGTLTFSGSYAAGQNLFDVGNDGFDSGKGVRQDMQTDWNSTSTGIIGIGYLGISDAKSAATSADDSGAGHDATYLSYNGVYESDAAVITGEYPYFGTEWLYGQVTPSAAALTAGSALQAGIAANVASIAAQPTGHDVRNNDSSTIIATSLMQVTRSHADSGFPVQCAPGAF